MKFILFIIGFFIANSSFSQTRILRGAESGEMVKLSNAFTRYDALNFNLDYSFADSINPSKILEHINGSCKLNKGRSWTMIDSTEIIQGAQYSVTVYHKDNMMVIGDRQTNPSFFSADDFGKLLNASGGDSLVILEKPDATNPAVKKRELTVYFRREAAYSKVVALYDPATYLIEETRLYLPGTPYEAGQVTSGTALIKILFQNYSFTAGSDEFFHEDRFFKIAGGSIIPAAAYSDFNIVSQISQTPVK